MPEWAHHTDSMDYPPGHRNVHDDNHRCPDGKQIKQKHRVMGTGGKPRCRSCQEAHRPVSL
jgi:hypothetical protein